MIYNIQAEIFHILNKDYKFFFSKPNVEGIAFGHKYINGTDTLEPSIHVFVSKKISSNYLSNNEAIPKNYKGMKTDVIETGFFSSDGNYIINNFSHLNSLTSNKNLNNKCKDIFSNALPYNQKIRPIQPGYCMSTTTSAYIFPQTGTFGYIVTDNKQESQTYCLLSVNKTFADLNNASIGALVMQPAFTSKGNPLTDVVGKLLRFQPLRFSPSVPNNITDFNTIDASVASLNTIGEISLINPFIPELGIPSGITSASIDQQIQWTSCITGHASNYVFSLGGILKINYVYRTAWFRNVIVTQQFTTRGDQGALVCDTNRKALGLLFATSDNLSCICDIKDILTTLDIKLLTT